MEGPPVTESLARLALMVEVARALGGSVTRAVL